MRLSLGTPLLGTLALAVGLWLNPAAAQDAEDPVLATVDGHEIRRSEVVDTISQLPDSVRRQFPPSVLVPMIADQLVVAYLVAERGYADGLQDTPEVQERLQQAERRIVRDLWLEQAVGERMDDSAVTELYEETLAAAPPAAEEVRASHILVETEDEARALIEQLAAGADFATLAREHSIDPASEQGGDLGYFTAEEMVPPFSEAAFAIEPGNVGEEPVQTEFGWHVIRVEDRRTPEPPSLEEVRPQLEEQVRQRLIQEIVAELRADAQIVTYGPDGEPRDPATQQ